ncbi:MAG: hypothetical protein HKL90_12360 [Elusimicrobia bacterium]|nr:hypothetical protein [Elusimicrobiota bacterium]
MENRVPEDRPACGRPPTDARLCPACGKRGREVSGTTLDRQLAPNVRVKFSDAAGFCAEPACPVVYFWGDERVLTGETLRAVAQKDPGEDVNVCYCFDFKRADLRRDLSARGATDIPARIEREIAAGRCDCERRNPQGSCCLGRLAEEIRAIAAELAASKK